MRFRSKRTIPGRFNWIARLIKIVLCLGLLLTAGITLWQAGQRFMTRGPGAIGSRLSDKLDRRVTLGSLAFLFPDTIRLKQLVVHGEGKEPPLLNCPTLDCRFSFRFLLGELELVGITLRNPEVAATRASRDLAGLPEALGRLLSKLDHRPASYRPSLDPLRWPFSLKLRNFTASGARLNFNDRLQMVPDLSGTFDLNLLLGEKNTGYPLHGTIMLDELAIVMRGLSAKISGAIELTRNLATPELRLVVDQDSVLHIRGAIRDYLHNPAAKLDLVGEGLDTAALTGTRLPFFHPAFNTMQLEGHLDLRQVRLPWATVPQVSGDFAIGEAEWRVGPLTVALPGDSGHISTTITFPHDPAGTKTASAPSRPYARISGDYHGQDLSDTRPLSSLCQALELEQCPPVDNFSAALELNSSEGQATFTSILLDNGSSSLLVEGRGDLPFTTLAFDGQVVLASQPGLSNKNPLPHGARLDRGKIVVPIGITGSIDQPLFTLPGKPKG